MKKKIYLMILSMVCSVSAWAQDDPLAQLTIVDGVAQIATAADLENFAQAVKAGNLDLNAVLTADIAEYTGPALTADGSANAYKGTFDGQYHTINIDMTSTGQNDGLFRALSGTVKNLHVSGHYTASYNRVGVICGEIFGGTIEYCWVSADIAATFGGDGAISGICGRASASGSMIRNCVFTGNVDSGDTGTYNCAGIVGWCANVIDIQNCVVSGTFNTNHLSGNARPLARYDDANNTNAKCVNCYYVDPNGDKTQPGAEQVTSEQMASGEVGYKLNGDQTSFVWFQNLEGDDIDPAPVPFPTHKTIYAAGNLNCVGQSADDSPLTYSNTKTQDLPPHDYVDGVCIVCGKADPSVAEMVDGYYLLSTPEQLIWFAAKVNGGDTKANAKLVEDIDLTAYTDRFPTIGTSTNRYAGTFDGQFHTITIDLVATEASYGFFRYLAGTVKNLHIDGNLDAAFNKVGVFAGEMFGATIERCWSSVNIAATFAGDGAIAGIAGRSSADGNTIRNCAFTGDIRGVAYNCAGIVGWCANLINIENCMVIATFDTDHSQGNARPIARHADDNTNANCVNCYYVDKNGDKGNAGATQVTLEQVASGEVAYKLNGDQSVITWFQKLEEEEFPTPMNGEAIVYNIYNVYGNAYDAASFKEYADRVIEAEEKLCDEALAQAILVDEYRALVAALANISTIEDLSAACLQNSATRDALLASAAAYAAYKAKVEEVQAYLEAHPELQNEKRTELEDYLNGFGEPTEDFPNGQAQFILDERALNAEEIAIETLKVDRMLEQAILFSPTSGTYVTRLLVNPDFSDGFNGWQGKVATGAGSSPSNSMRAAECYNSTMDMYQTLTNLENGVYELQINGAYRPYPGEDLRNTNYAATFYANDVQNYFMANIEGMIPAAEAVDGFNCHITGDVPDFVIESMEGAVEGYTVHGIIGCCNAFEAGRYFNSVLVNVTDGTLTVGIRQPSTGFQPEWLGFGNIQLIYHGTMDEANEGLDRVLESMSARANTIANDYEFSMGDDYANYPNLSQALKDELNATIQAVETTSDASAKYALVVKFSELFQQVFECKKAYVNLLKQTDELYNLVSALGELLTNDQIDEVYKLIERLEAMYIDGTASIEEALTDYVGALSFTLQQKDGIYQIGTPADLVLFATKVNGGENKANAVLTADINMDRFESYFVPIASNASADTYYAGTFDGQYHTITLNWSTPDQNYGIFRALSGTVKNLHVAGTLEALSTRTGAIVGESFAGTIENCWSSVDITTNVNNNATAGILGRSSADGTIVRNCIYSGNITGGENASNCAGIIGYSSSTSTVTNCLVTGTITTGIKEAGYIIARNAGQATCSNCYFVTPYEGTNAGATQVTMEQVTSGEVCFLLNGDQKLIQWTQTLAESTVPVPFTNQSVVYIHGNLNCDGVTLIDGEATYANEPCTTIAPHTFVDGVCVVCGAANPDMADLVDGYYLLDTPEKLLWFAAKVNAGENSINAKLTADIDLTSVEDKFVPVGTSTFHYAGIFDGQYHTINVNFTATASSYGFFRFVDGTIRNLHMSGTYVAAFNKTGVICGELFGGLIENCWVSSDIQAVYNGDAATAAIAGRGSKDGSIIRNCLFTGTIDQGETTTWNCASIMGWSGNKSTIENCLTTATINVDVSQGNAYIIARNPGNLTIKNCYFVNAYGDVNDGATQVTGEQVASGEVCYLLNGDQSVIQWTQKLGEESTPLPFPTSSVVTRNDDGTYGNGTGVEMVQEFKSARVQGIYDLSGRRLDNGQCSMVNGQLPKGIYIINGKKVVVK
ncbi:MAG: right-handed parallel beta-helix repeat-containing protein [Bacteroidaceae bacterium]|nr:right-handed parallel beta-helix repeat-containing protein [Bacteroidaceae bacterium]